MLSSVEILILAAIQGIFEFLPVSSFAHLVFISIRAGCTRVLIRLREQSIRARGRHLYAMGRLDGNAPLQKPGSASRRPERWLRLGLRLWPRAGCGVVEGHAVSGLGFLGQSPGRAVPGGVRGCTESRYDLKNI